LIAFFANKDFSTISIVSGQYIGVSLLIIISSLAYFSKFIIPSYYIALFGILPIIIGMKNLWNLKKDGSKNLLNETYIQKNQNTNDYIELKIWSYRTFRVALATLQMVGIIWSQHIWIKGKLNILYAQRGIYNILNFFLNN